MKYSFHCEKCGHTVLSNKKADVVAARELHKPRTAKVGLFLRKVPGCLWIPTNRGTYARPSLAKIINSQV